MGRIVVKRIARRRMMEELAALAIVNPEIGFTSYVHLGIEPCWGGERPPYLLGYPATIHAYCTPGECVPFGQNDSPLIILSAH